MSRRTARIATLALAALTARAQNVTGTITGLVTDATGAVVPGASVKALRRGTNASFSGVTDAVGTYVIRSLPIGEYQVQAQAAGFKRFESSAIRLQVNEVVRLDIGLTVGQTTDVVEVQAKAVTVDTTSPVLKGVIDQRRIEDLPLNGRDATQLMRLVAGVQIGGGDVISPSTFPGVTGVSVNGSRSNTTNYILDGAQNNDHYNNAPYPLPNPDALAEFSVQTNSFSAEYGRNLGGVVNAVTKSGTNEFHGVAFGYLRNYALNAANFFAPPKATNPNEKQDDGLKRTQFGGTLGGPIVKDRLFFFGSYQGTRLRQRPVSRFVNTFTSAERSGDFSATTTPVRDPDGGTFPGNRIPISRFDRAAYSLLQDAMPIPASGRELFIVTPSDRDEDQYLFKTDYQWRANHSVSGRFARTRSDQPGTAVATNYYAWVTGRKWINDSVAFKDTFTFSPAVINEANFSYSRLDTPSFPTENPSKSWKDRGSAMSVGSTLPYDLRFQTIANINIPVVSNFYRKEWQLSDTLRWTRGRHQLSFGGGYNYGWLNVVCDCRSSATITFNAAAGYTNLDRADYLLGRFQRFQQQIGQFKDTRFHLLSGFAQDNFKVTRRLSLDFGVRWDPYMPQYDAVDRMAVWAPGQQSQRFKNAPAGILYPGDPGVARGGSAPSWGNVAPRAGFAWDLTGKGTTSVRGGFGIFFEQPNTIQSNGPANQVPFGYLIDFFGNAQNSVTTPFAGFPGGNPLSVVGLEGAAFRPANDARFFLPLSAWVFARDLRAPRSYSWNLTLEHELPGGFVTRASYAGSRGLSLVSARDMSAPVACATCTTATIDARRQFAPNFGAVLIAEPSGNSFFHSGQFTVERRFSGGFTVLANYMISKSIDDNSGSANKGDSASVTDPFNQRFDRGPAQYDHRHVFNFSGLWSLPGRYENKLAKWVLGGWNMSSIVSLNSGAPYAVVSGQDNARTGQGGQRADLTGQGVSLGDGRGRGDQVFQYLNRAAFRVNAVGTYGQLGRNTYYGPGRAVVDAGLHKNFAITERVNTQFRFEAFNAANRVNLNNPDSTVTSANFMRITGTSTAARVLQFALRVNF